MTYQPFIDDTEHITELDRQRFVVVRPSPAVADVHGALQRVLRERLSGSRVSYPARAHVTLAGFAAGTPLDAVQDLAGAWARRTPALRIEIERVTSFPQPFQVAILQIRKTPELLTALGSLRRGAEEQRFSLSTPIAPDDWVFHMSVAYCSRMTHEAWDQLTQFIQTLDVTPAHCVAEHAEVVAFDEGREYSGGLYQLQADQAPPDSITRAPGLLDLG